MRCRQGDTKLAKDASVMSMSGNPTYQELTDLPLRENLLHLLGVFQPSLRSRCSSCVRTVPESNGFNRIELSLSEKQIPRFVGNVNS
jgi:hypothetical protein